MQAGAAASPSVAGACISSLRAAAICGTAHAMITAPAPAPVAERFGPLELASIRGLTGLDVLQRIHDGSLPMPPICETLNFRLTRVEYGAVAFAGDPGAAHLNPLGTIHGGWTSTLLDSCMGCSVHSTLAAEQVFTTVELKVSFIKAITPDRGRVIAEGRVLSAGRRLATAEGRLVDGKGTLLAHATTTCFIMTVDRA